MLYLNGQPLSVTIFPDGTSQVWKLQPDILHNVAHVKWVFENEAEFLHLAQLKSLLDSCDTFSSLELKYLPYGRQDKEISNTSTFALRTFAALLNSLNFTDIAICDPHSEVAIELIKNSYAIYPYHMIDLISKETGTNLVCYPDKGAVSKYTKIYNRPHIFGEKVRDQLTGNITAYTLYGECYGKKVLIVDDICDGGMTFKLLAKDLLAAGAESVVLFVTHGIFSKGLQTLKDSGIQRIYTQDGEAIENEGQIIYRRL